MATHNETGIIGENLAADWLKKNEYEILHRNWRYKQYEIDIIAQKKDMLHFIEVKCRWATPLGFPEDKVTRKKIKDLQRAADEFLFLNPGHKWIQFDVLAITLYRDKTAEYFLIEDVNM